MRTRVVPAAEISSRSLRASDYIKPIPPDAVFIPGKEPAPGTPIFAKHNGDMKSDLMPRALTGYERYIVEAFKALCEENKKKGIEGASPDEVTKRMARRGELAALDTVLDIADIMKDLRGKGWL
jgi:hypothetical protein